VEKAQNNTENQRRALSHFRSKLETENTNTQIIQKKSTKTSSCMTYKWKIEE
jgi:hypothetical protein